MKKIICALLWAILFVPCFAEQYFNFTFSDVFMANAQFQNYTKYDFEESDYIEETKSQYDSSLRFTAEYFRNVNDSPFVVGLKAGAKYGFLYGTAYNSTVYYKTFGTLVSPCFGWAFGEKLRKKITVYPSYEHVWCCKGKSNNKKLPSASLDILNAGASFSLQWGNNIQNGFEAGVDYGVVSLFQINGKKIGDLGSGLSGYVAYKLSFRRE